LSPQGYRSVSRPAVFLDRDGTLNRDIGYAHRPQDLVLLDYVLPGLRKLQDMGFALVVVTNQSGIARGYFSEAQMHEFHAALRDELRRANIELTGIYHCPFHPALGPGDLRVDSPLRKPQPGMLLAAAADHDLDLSASFAIGDKRSDVLAGQRAGCRTILVQTGAAGRGEPELDATPDFVASHLLAAANWIAAKTGHPTDIPHFLNWPYPATASQAGCREDAG
jgi:D-glycero-D-manno-heptose 1,7-bisphosphate phosphatase